MTKIQRPTYFYATVSVSIVLILIALFLTLFFHANNITNIIKQQINILVEVQDVLPNAEVENLKSIIKNFDGVIVESVEFYDKEQAMEFMSKELAEMSNEIENPFKNIIKFNLIADKYNESYIKELKAKLEMEKGVIGLYYENESIDLVRTNLTSLSYIILALAIIFVILALAIIYNTMRLSLYADEKNIRTMQIVGAENSFIRKPYLKSAIKMSLIGTFMAGLVLGSIYYFGQSYNELLREIFEFKFFILTLIVCFVMAIAINLGSTTFILSKFLKHNR